MNNTRTLGRNPQSTHGEMNLPEVHENRAIARHTLGGASPRTAVFIKASTYFCAMYASYLSAAFSRTVVNEFVPSDASCGVRSFSPCRDCMKEDLFVLSGSFGALSTLVYASPAASLAQPRIIFFAHGLAIMLSVSHFKCCAQPRSAALRSSLYSCRVT